MTRFVPIHIAILTKMVFRWFMIALTMVLELNQIKLTYYAGIPIKSQCCYARSQYKLTLDNVLHLVPEVKNELMALAYRSVWKFIKILNNLLVYDNE